MRRTPTTLMGGAPRKLFAASMIAGLLMGTLALAESARPPRLSLSVQGIKREAAMELSRELRATVRGASSEGKPAHLKLRSRPAPPIKTEDPRGGDELRSLTPGSPGSAAPGKVRDPGATGQDPSTARQARRKKPARSSTPDRKSLAPATPGKKQRTGGLSNSLLEDANRLARPAATPGAGASEDPGRPGSRGTSAQDKRHAKPEAPGSKGAGTGSDGTPGAADRAAPHGPPGTTGGGTSGTGGTRSGGQGTGPGGNRR